MSTRRTGTTLVTILLLLLLLTGLAQAQGPEPTELTEQAPVGVEIFEDPAASAGSAPAAEPAEAESVSEPPTGPDLPEEPADAAGVSAAMSDIIPFQGRLTNAAGVPINGSRSIRLALYDVPSGGTALCEDTDTVTVSNGLFVFNMNFCSAADTDGKQLYLGIKVGADAEMTPRQPVYPAPFARSVRPGAVINQTSTSARGLTVQSAGAGSAGTALWVENTAPAAGGVGVWSSVAGSDASIVASNNGAGALFKGFGADGGEDEIRINNNGSIETKADSYIFVPGNVLIKNLSADSTRWDVQFNGAARIWRGGAAGSKAVYFPITLPTQLYGQPVKVESITVYYKTLDGTKGYIDETRLYKQTDADSEIALISNSTDHTSGTASSYTLSPTADNVLSSNQGLGLYIVMAFADDTNWVQIGGIRIHLGHHDLY